MAQSQNMTTDNKYIVYYVVMNVQSQNISANTSNVNVYVYVKRTNTGYETYGNGTVYCTVNGTQFSEAITSAQHFTNTPTLVLAKNVDVPHNSDGTKTLIISARIDHSRFHSSPQTQSWSTNLATIPRGSKFGTIPNFTIDANPNVGAAFSVPVTKYASSFTDTLSISVGGSTVATRSGYTSGTVTFSASELTAIYSKMSANSATFTFNLTTKNGSTTIGTDSKTAVGSISSTGRAPTFSASNVSYADTNPTTLALTGNASKIIKGQSTVAVTLATKASANKGASLGSNAYAVSVGNATQYVNQSATFPATVSFSNANADSAGVVVTDSRGNKTSITKTMTVVDYAPPTATGKATRVNPDYTGQTLKLELSGTYTNWTGLTTANGIQSLQYRTRQYPYGSWSAYTSITPTQSAGKWSFSNTISGTYAAGNQYEVEVVATDRLASATLSSVVDTITPIMDIDADTRCVGIGKLHDDDLPDGSLDVYGTLRCGEIDQSCMKWEALANSQITILNGSLATNSSGRLGNMTLLNMKLTGISANKDVSTAICRLPQQWYRTDQEVSIVCSMGWPYVQNTCIGFIQASTGNVMISPSVNISGAEVRVLTSYVIP